MSTISTAVGLERLSRVSGYEINKGFFTNETPNLPQIIAIFGEANTANQSGLTTTKKEVTSAKEAAQLYGYGSPIHQMMRILRPLSGDGVGGIPTVVFPQISSESATETEREWTVTGTATANATHKVIVNGRDGLDFQFYDFNVVVGDTATVVAAGMSYSETDSNDGTGAVSLADSLAQFGDTWYTIVLNPYGSAQFSALETFNGTQEAQTGRYAGLVFKPFMAYFGSTLNDKDDLVAITDASARREQVTNVLCPAPLSGGFNCEAAANVVALFSRKMQDTPHLDVNNMSYPDMPVPTDGNIGDMSDYNNRDFLIKKGCSTVILENGAYKIQDLVTTYHPAGESPLQYNYCRNVNLDWNVCDSYRTLEAVRLRDKTLVADNQNVDVSGVIKPKEWKAVVFDLFDDLAEKALINDPAFSKSSLLVQISTINPNRFETFFRYKRTGVARIESTTVEAGF